MTSLAGTTLVVLAALAGVAEIAPAQSIASRVARVSNGTVRMSFAAKPGICGSGNSIRHDNGRGRTIVGRQLEYLARRRVGERLQRRAGARRDRQAKRRAGRPSLLCWWALASSRSGRRRSRYGARARSGGLPGLDRAERTREHGREGDLARDDRRQRQHLARTDQDRAERQIYRAARRTSQYSGSGKPPERRQPRT